MALTYFYPDAYLQPLITEPREQRAASDVADLGALPEAWLPRLVVLRAYVITCLESQRTADDLFGVKLTQYRKEFTDALAQARAHQAAADAAAGRPGGFGAGCGVVQLERG
jgi:hypothetical protein